MHDARPQLYAVAAAAVAAYGVSHSRHLFWPGEGSCVVCKAHRNILRSMFGVPFAPYGIYNIEHSMCG